LNYGLLNAKVTVIGKCFRGKIQFWFLKFQTMYQIKTTMATENSLNFKLQAYPNKVTVTNP